MAKFAPSILSADFSKLGEQTEIVSSAGADYLHIDVMDGHFVPNITYGAPVMKCLDNCETAPYDVHLMIENPDQFLKARRQRIKIGRKRCFHLCILSSFLFVQ